MRIRIHDDALHCRGHVGCRTDYAGGRSQLCQLSKILRGSREQELVAGAEGTSQSETAEAQDAFEMGKQHLVTRGSAQWSQPPKT
jgi:hypothetical protein